MGGVRTVFLFAAPSPDLIARSIPEDGNGCLLLDANADGAGDTVMAPHRLARVGELNTDADQGRYYLPFVLTDADRQAVVEGRRVKLYLSYGASANVLNAQVEGGGVADLLVDLYGYRNRTAAVPAATDYHNANVTLLHESAVTPATSTGILSFDVTDFVREESAAGSVVAFRLQIDPAGALPNQDGLPNRYSLHSHLEAGKEPRLEIVSGAPVAENGRILIDANGDGLGDSVSAADRLARVGEVNTDADQGRYYLPFALTEGDRLAVAEGARVNLQLSYGISTNVSNLATSDGKFADLRVDLFGYLDRAAELPAVADYHDPNVSLLRAAAVAPETVAGILSFDVTDFVREESASGPVVAFRLQIEPFDVLPNGDGVPNRFIFHSHLEEEKEPRLDILVPPAPDDSLFGTEGFQNTIYPGGMVLGTNSIVAGFEGSWIGTTSSVSQMEGPSLTFSGYTDLPGGEIVTAGNRRLSVSTATNLSRQFLTGNNGPLGLFVDGERIIARAPQGTSLYLAFLMRVTSLGETPPLGGFSLYHGGTSTADRQFRIAYAADRIEAMAGDSGTPAVLAARDAATKLFVVRLSFVDGDDTIEVWVNPSLGGEAPSPGAVLHHDLAFDRFGVDFDLPSGSDAAGEFAFDEMRIAATWNGVTLAESVAEYPPPVAAPPEEEWGMQGFPPSPRVDGLYPEGFFPFIDRFGQYRHLEWTDKVSSKEELVARTEAEELELSAILPRGRSRFGGWSQGPRLYGTGMFRTAKYNGDWWLVDPDGYLFFSSGITTVGSVVRTEAGALASQKTGITGREHFFADLPGSGEPATVLGFYADETATVGSGDYQGTRPLALNFFAANALMQFPGADSVASFQAATDRLALDRLRSWGFNTVAGWSDSSLSSHPERLPYTPVLFPANPPGIGDSGALFPDYFRDVYAVNVKKRLFEETGGTREDSWNVGYFIHNEPGWAQSTTEDIDVGLATLRSPRATLARYAKQAFVDLMQSRYLSIAELNAAWLANYTSWSNMLDRTDISFDVARASDDLKAFGVAYTQQYFRTNRDAMREVAPGHLYLGSRFTSGVILRPEVARAAIEFCDVFSMNRYAAEVGVFDGMEADVPMMVTEYATWTTDTGLFGSTQGPQGSEAERPATFGNQLYSAIVHPRYVGAHWFQYFDFPTSGRLTQSNNNSNYGFVQITNTPYRAMVDEARSLHYPMYELRARVGAGTPAADAYVEEGAASGENFGLANKLKVSTATGSAEQDAYLKFDLAEVHHPVDRAILTLYPLAEDGSPVHALAEVFDDAWSETGLTWDNQPGGGGTVFVSWTPVAGEPIDLDVTGQLNAAVAAGRALTLRVFHWSGDGFASYGSREGLVENRPELRVVAGPADLDTWRAQYFPPDSPEGADFADPSNDGVSNLLKYALGLNPVVPSRQGLPQVSRRENGEFTMTFYRARADIVYTVETSPDLESWTELAVDPGEPGGNVTVVYQPDVSETSRFFRLRVAPR